MSGIGRAVLMVPAVTSAVPWALSLGLCLSGGTNPSRLCLGLTAMPSAHGVEISVHCLCHREFKFRIPDPVGNTEK